MNRSLLLLLLAILSPIAMADKYAILIGIANYEIDPLEGPVNDVNSLEKLLQGPMGFRAQNIVTLRDAQATHQAILEALQALSKRLRADDFVFLYFSGHGTSAFDPNTLTGITLGSGALVPFDVNRALHDRLLKGDREGLRKLQEVLLIGDRDLKPWLLDWDRRGCHTLVVFDNCYAGRTVRAIVSPTVGQPKFMDLPITLAGDEELIREERARVGAANQNWSYQNLVYLAATSEKFTAKDLRKSDIRMGTRTIDGKAHGALTQEILSAAASATTDFNGDGHITIAELFKQVQERAQTNYGQTPQLYPRTGGDALFAQPLMRASTGTRIDDSSTLRVGLDDSSRHLSQRVSALEQVKLVKETAQIRVAFFQNAYHLTLENGSLLCRLDDETAVLQRLRLEAQLKPLLDLRPKGEGFFLYATATDRGLNGQLGVGDTVSFRVDSDRDAYLLMINIDPAGQINLLLPRRDPGKARIQAGMPLNLSQLGKVSEPLGRELFKVFAFTTRPSFFDGLAGRQFGANAADLADLIRSIQAEPRYTLASFQITTGQ